MVDYENVKRCIVSTARKGHVLGIFEDSLVGHLALRIANSHFQPLWARINPNVTGVHQSIWAWDLTVNSVAGGVTSTAELNGYNRGEVNISCYTLQWLAHAHSWVERDSNSGYEYRHNITLDKSWYLQVGSYGIQSSLYLTCESICDWDQNANNVLSKNWPRWILNMSIMLLCATILKRRLSVTNLSSENNWLTFWLNAPVIIKT